MFYETFFESSVPTKETKVQLSVTNHEATDNSGENIVERCLKTVRFGFASSLFWVLLKAVWT